MNFLAVDTSSSRWAVAAVSAGKAFLAPAAPVVASSEPRRLSRQIVTAIDEVLANAGWTLADIDAIGVALGPGSWTGLRIGLSTCKTLAQVRGLELRGVPTFDACAAAAWQSLGSATDESANALLLVTAPCRPGEIYSKLILCGEDRLRSLAPESISTPAATLEAAGAALQERSIDTPLLLAGEGATAMQALLQESGRPHRMVHVDVEAVVRQVAELAAAALQQGQPHDPLSLQPLYLAPSAAERNLEKAQ
jgi:tRNA threonylcarbamoyladenosine biosynthesis protein TsaB